MMRKVTVASVVVAAALVFAPLAGARSIGECDAFCSHHHGNHETCYKDCLRR